MKKLSRGPSVIHFLNIGRISIMMSVDKDLHQSESKATIAKLPHTFLYIKR